ncbi:S8 family serine peptidase [bacterium]|nr:S8 family serine peptidase [bacterium]
MSFNRLLVSLSFLIIILFLMITGCSSKHDPVSGNIKGTSLHSIIPLHPVLSNVNNITLDNEPALGLGYFYGYVKPETRHTFHADFSQPLHWKWHSDDIDFISPSSGIGANTELAFIAPANEGEISISLDLSLDGTNATTTRWRIHVDANPIEVEYIHPVYENSIEIGDPFKPVKTEIAENEIIVFFIPEVNRETAIRTIFNMECTILAEIPDLNMYRVYSFDDDTNTSLKLEAFDTIDEVVETHPNYIYRATITPDDTYWSQKWDLRKIQADDAWDVETGDSSQVLAIIDTGIDRDHPDLGAKVIDGMDFITPPGDGLGGETDGDGVDNNGNGRRDENVGHGTHCAGIAAAISNNSLGTTGVSWDTKLIPLRIFPINGDSGASWDAVMGAYNWLKNNAVSKNIVGANMSYGGFGGYSSTTQSVLTQCFNNGVILCAACGNSGTPDADWHYPSAYDNVISVAATNSSDVKASFSTYGTSVDVSAPGVGIRSTYYNDTYADASGTSMASPEVTGLVGLVKSRWPAYTQQEYINQIKFTADNIDALNPSYVGKLGSGRINAFRAVTQGLTPDLILKNLIVDEDEIGWTDGNRDRLINSGEDALIQLKVKNNGLTVAHNVEGVLVTDNPMVHVVDDTITYALINIGETVTIDDAFKIVVDKLLPDGTDVEFTFTLDDGDNNGPWVYNEVIKIYKNNMVDEVLTVSGGPIGPDFLVKGQENVPLIRIDFDAASNYVLIKNLILTCIGTSPGTAVDAVHLYLDSNGNGVYDGIAFEQEIGLSSYFSPTFYGNFDRLGDPHNNPGQQPIDEIFPGHQFDAANQVTFEDVIIPVTEDKTTTIFVTVDINMTPCPDDTLGAGIAHAYDIELMDSDTVEGTFPLGALEREIIPTWEDDVQVTFRNTDYTWRAECAVDNLGYVHLLWDEINTDASPNFDIGYRRSTDKGETWGVEQLIVSDNHKSFFPDIAVTDNDTLHVMFYDTPQGVENREIFYMRSFDNGDSWEDPRQLTDTTGESVRPCMYAEGSILHAAFNSTRDGTDDIYYFRSDDNGANFTDPVQVCNSSRISEEACLAALDGEIHIGWQDVVKDPYYHYYIIDAYAMYAYSSDNGETFSSAENLSNAVGGDYCYHTNLDIDDESNCHVVFHSEGAGSFDVYMCSGSGGTLSTAERVTFIDDCGTGMPYIIVDDEGRKDLFYDNTCEGITNIWHQYMESDSTEWSEPVRLSTNFTGDAQIPNAVKDDAKNLYCFWQDNRMSTGRDEIWFNRMLYGCE